MRNFNPNIWPYIRANIRANTRVVSCFLVWVFMYTSVWAEQPVEVVNQMPQQCSTDCESKYGSVLGESPAGIAAYSNCNSNCVIFEPHHFNEIYTGIKWQCVEYARRWLLREKEVVFGDVDIAADIWSMQQVENPISKQKLKFHSIVNGTEELPQRGDLLIYGKNYLGTGHVAVVVGIDEKKQMVQVAEQNYANKNWQGEFAREIAYTKNENRNWLLDSYLVGWKRVGSVKQ